MNYYSSPNINFIIGDVNIKRKIRINIDRNDFSNGEQLEKLIRRFEIKILEEVFSALSSHGLSSDQRVDMTESFLNNYCSIDHSMVLFDERGADRYFQLLNQQMYFDVYFPASFQKSGVSSINISSLLSLNVEFMMIAGDDDESKVLQKFNLPVIKLRDEGLYDVFNIANEMFFKIFKCYREIVSHQMTEII